MAARSSSTRASDMPAFQMGTLHSGAYPLDNQAALEPCGRAHDDHDGPTSR